MNHIRPGLHSEKRDTTSPSGSKDLVGVSSSDSRKKWWVLIAIGAGTFMSALDGSVVNTTLPIIRNSLNSDIAAIEWVVTIYLLILSGLLLSFGRLGDMQGHKSVYISGFVIFLISSAFCGLAPTATFLIAFRASQAFGAAMIQANSPAILTKSFPPEQRGQALGMQATMTYLGLIVGPSLGGWLADQFSWRWVFYINIPIGFVVLWLSIRFISRELSYRKKEHFDFIGACLFTIGLILLLIGLNQGHALGWTSWPIIGMMIFSMIFLFAFILVEKNSPFPMLDLSLFSKRVFSTSVSSAVLNYLCVYSIIFLMPFYLIQGRGFSPTQTGVILITQPLVMAVIAPISGTVSDRIGTRMPATIGMAILSVGLFSLAELGASSNPARIAFALSICGLGTGMFISPNNSALLGSAPRHRQGIAAGILATARNMGMVLGVGLSGAIFTTMLNNQTDIEPAALFKAIQLSFLVAVGIAIMGSIISAIRPKAS
jgi:EmrB/QacA subfamily drug resistance transporter